MSARSVESDSAPDNSELTVSEIKEKLDGKGIEYPSNTKKADLLALLNEDE